MSKQLDFQLHKKILDNNNSMKQSKPQKRILPVSNSIQNTPLARKQSKTNIQTPVAGFGRTNTSVNQSKYGKSSANHSRRGSDFSDNSMSMIDPFSRDINYKCVEGDKIDELLEQFCRTNKVKIPIHRIDESRYLFGTKIINIQIINGQLMVRVGGGFMELENYIDKNSSKEIFKLRVKMANEKKKMDKLIKELIEKNKIKKFI